MKISIMLILFSLLTNLSVQSQEFEYSFKEVYEILAPTKLNISSSNSNIKVISHDKENIEVYFVVKKDKKLLSDNKKNLTQLINEQSKLNIQSSADELKLEVTNAVKEGYINSKDAIIIDFIVYVPKQTSCDLVSSDGTITLKGLNSNQKCVTNDGNIELININGDVIAKTSDGDIIIENVIGNVDSQTMDGQVIKTKR
ncbi:hypothetical protein JM83_0963 [Gillisia sp. Hel_I_86]|uniref:hypothetical protein n=1 Tax=Gillisia sp. Hel_I_86 TaxID=1249981 RepID=UPI001199B7D9|nr:hypothetical protein [Gillisia sp. Hel_I_86]TVZ26018.1 hypothetical protein JM83_0963 [Gillisia sp. Hel_I_86]